MAKKILQLQVESADLTVPQDRIEGFLAKAAGLVGTMPEGQFSRLERYLAIIAAGGGGGGAPIDSPTFTGVPKAPTAEKGTDTTQIATTQFVQTAVDDKQNTLGYATAEVNRLLGLVDAADEVANAGVAPGGFGLGGTPKLLTSEDDLNTIIAPGWYYWAGSASAPQNAPEIAGSAGFQAMFVSHRFQNTYTEGQYTWVKQSVKSFNNSDNNKHSEVEREIRKAPTQSGDYTTPWEWVNPPMLEGVEYRTTERFLGKPVYVIFKEYSDNSFNTEQHISVQNIDYIVEAKSLRNRDALPSIQNNSLADNWSVYLAYCSRDNTGIVFKVVAGTSASSGTLRITIKYTKTTN